MTNPFAGRLIGVIVLLSSFGAAWSGAAWAAEPILLSGPDYRMRIEPAGFRFSFQRPDGAAWVPAHATSGLQLGKNVDSLQEVRTTEQQSDGRFVVTTEGGLRAAVAVRLEKGHVRLSVRPEEEGTYTIVARTGPIGPAFGLSDHGGSGRDTTDLAGFVSDDLRAGTGKRPTRLISNFMIAPGNGFAAVNVEPWRKIVRVTDSELAQGARDVREMPVMCYFLGTPREIYASYLRVRNELGYKVYPPKYAFFGVGWEAFGALAWDTNTQTVTDNVTRYLDAGYPLTWMVIGSGFWPRHDPSLLATTSFGMWDPKLYPNPKALIDHFHGKGLKVFLGLRIAFITTGPFAEEGVRGGYFMKENGEAKVFKIAFPKSPCYLLDTANPKAVEWYVGLCGKWLEYGIDGFKEDLFGYGAYVLRDDKLDPVNAALMDKGVFVMGRNGYLGSPADVHRYEDFNVNQNQDRGPINGLAFAYSGFPYVYPDIVGGTQVKTFPKPTDPKLKKYLMRYAQYAAVNPSMSMGYGPWNCQDEQVDRVVLDAARLHGRLHPYIFSAAIQAYHDGFPHTLAPLPLVYPDDVNVYGRENARVRGYQWMLGPSLLATPLYGEDYADADTRDVYLPAGKWMDYDTGEMHEGPKLLRAFPLPHGKTPLFVGGAGVVVEKVDGALQARVYPVTSHSDYTFYDEKGQQASTIRVRVGNWDDVIIRDASTGQAVPTQRVRHALEFVLKPGTSYEVTDAGR